MAGDRIYIKRTSTVGNIPANNTLNPGELCVQMAEATAPRLWVGVPTSIAASGMRLLADLGQGVGPTGFLPLTGGTLTGNLGIQTNNQPSLIFNDTAVGNTTGGVWRFYVGSAGFMNLQMNQSSDNSFAVAQQQFTISPAGDASLYGTLRVNSPYAPNPVLTVSSNGYSNLLAPDVLAGAADACISLGVSANGTNFYRNAGHTIQNRGATITYMQINSAAVTANLPIASLGGSSGLQFADRTNSNNTFIWYATSNIARLYNTADRWLCDNVGNVTVTGGETVNGALNVGGRTNLYSDLVLQDSRGTGFIARPNVAGKKIITFCVDGGTALDNINMSVTLLQTSGFISVGGNPTAILGANTSYSYLYTPDNIGAVIVGTSSSGGATNYYRNGLHDFQDRAGSVNWVTLNGGGLTSSVQVNTNAGLVAAGSTGGWTIYCSGTLGVNGLATFNTDVNCNGNMACSNMICNSTLRVMNNRAVVQGSSSPSIASFNQIDGYAWGFWSASNNMNFGMTDANGVGQTSCMQVVPNGNVHVAYSLYVGESLFNVSNGYVRVGPGYVDNPNGASWGTDVWGDERCRNVLYVYNQAYSPVWHTQYPPNLTAMAGATPYEHGLSTVLRLQPYLYPAGGARRVGLAVEELQTVMPEMLSVVTPQVGSEGEPEEEITGLDNAAVTFALVNAVRELTDRISQLEAKG